MVDNNAKTAIITGASRGVGAATAIRLAKAGYRVLVNFVANETAANDVVGRIRKDGGTAEPCRADVSRFDQCRAMADRCVELWGRIDLLVNNAGIWYRAPIDSMTEEELRRTIDVNLYGVFFPTMAVVGHMKKRRSGNIINISSTAGQRGEAFHSPYAATKGAIISMTKSWAPELIADNIRVNCVAPGWVVTDMSHDSLTGPDRESVLRLIPAGRAATPDEIAGAVLYLASDESSFVIGEILNVNGGAVLCG